ncbi:peptidoglycan editing factor PgeF [Alteribacter populi]|uniref:peptidoglycan editing factor PgeF n=1 Tax=Alteribacter populi TaxID=2011011 RepID=UPI000BBB416B|nr:peptidoglycan editing factor PgeF [Alteribacter populi]
MTRDEPFIQSNSPLHLQLSPFLDLNPSITVGFSTRKGGTSISPYDSLNLGLHTADADNLVTKNREKLGESLRFPLKNWVVGEQIHSNHVRKIAERDKGGGAIDLTTAIPETDGIYTKERGILLTSMYADCVPLYFYAPDHDLIGLAHAGWKGTTGNIVQNMIDAFVKEGADKSGIYAAIGPAISKRCYEVDDRVVSEIKKLSCSDMQSVIEPRQNQRYFLNLKEVNRQLLLNSGVDESHIFVSRYCTYKEEQLFYSYRRDSGKTGRMMSFIGLPT